MGFGILFFGYFAAFAFTLGQIYLGLDVIGAGVCLWAFAKLSRFSRYFRPAFLACAAFLILSGVNGAAIWFSIYPTDGYFALAIQILREIAACGTHVFLFLGTLAVAKGADSDKILRRAKRCFAATMVYYTFRLPTLALSRVFAESQVFGAVRAIVYLYWFVLILLNLALIYVCFGVLIPADEDEGAERKRSRFRIVNFMNDQFEKFDRKSNEYRRQSMQLAMDEANRMAEKKRKKGGKKKR